ncbi:MAG: TIGR03960 family B12-binding radical SAM protein [Oscillospiraceae bacterium]|nr:TIGR03960 family B12-binding radical SAM protein [Oscillospiraceae bacterium]
MNRLEDLLPTLRKPARYVGGEYNAVMKNKDAVELRVAFCFPDTYEIGMSHLGTRILYGLMNELDFVWCERAFAPWTDMETMLRTERLPLWALESGDPLSAFDVLAFTLQYELSYTNVLNMLDLGGLPIRAADRDDAAPLVIAGGPCAFNPEPMADFIDLFVIGEGEEVTAELMDLFRARRRHGWSKAETLRRAVLLEGVYAPSLYAVSYREDGAVAAVAAQPGAPARVTKRIVRDLDSVYFPVKPLVPNTEVVHDRIMLELFRGCIRGCRFCQAGFTTRPVRTRSVETLVRQGLTSLAATGYEEISLTSLSTSDYRPLEGLCDALLGECQKRRVGLSLPSLRADSFSRALMERVQSVRKSGLTFAPEAGSARLRDVINKNLTEEDLMRACGTAFEGGWNHVKLYFMCGLPTETDEDLAGIADLAHKVYALGRATAGRARGVGVTVSTACFVPKPHTPFQWEAQDSVAVFAEKQAFLRARLRKQITFRWHAADTSFLEGALARGDRRVGAAVEAAWRSGCRLDGWSECFSSEAWHKAFASCGLSLAFYAARTRAEDEVLPWAHISASVDNAHLWRERTRAYAGTASPNCREHCLGCGASRLLAGGVCDG